eukprot:GFKZ01001257.1.p1 GENE.GFKZ01001257.1~~GFKZ01001257.1.p1  ORF type:complete len:117 (+),score=8.98 GFKZ01001257.1:73-423(+)
MAMTFKDSMIVSQHFFEPIHSRMEGEDASRQVCYCATVDNGPMAQSERADNYNIQGLEFIGIWATLISDLAIISRSFVSTEKNKEDDLARRVETMGTLELKSISKFALFVSGPVLS